MGWATLLHLLGIVVWVGGMFFAYVVLRPTAAQLLEPPLRLSLWGGVFRRFFPWVWASVALILFSGLYMIMVLGGFGAIAPHIHIMFLAGIVMLLIFSYVYFVPYPRLAQAVSIQDWKSGGEALAKIRKLIGINLSIGLINILIGISGRILG